MRRVRYLSVFILMASFVSKIYCQTIGIGEVQNIENKARQIDTNRKNIAAYKLEIPELERARNEKIQKLRDQLLVLQKERDNIVSDMKVGARCSECKRWKTELEKAGINFQQHLGEVKGYAIPATTPELESIRTQYGEKMAIIKVQIQRLEKGDDAYLKLLANIKKLEDDNLELCSEITRHSELYHEKVSTEGTEKQESWTAALMDNVSVILINQDKTALYTEQQNRFQKDFQKAKEDIAIQVKKNMESQQQKLLDDIASNDKKLQDLIASAENSKKQLENDIDIKNKEKENVQKESVKPDLLENEKEELKQKIESLASQIVNLESQVQKLDLEVKSYTENTKQENARLKSAISALPSNLSKVQIEETAKIKPVFDEKIAGSRRNLNNSITDVIAARTEYQDKVRELKTKNSEYVNLITAESSRMVVAAQSVSCVFRNETLAFVNMNWNNLFSCVQKISALAKPSSMDIFNSYCSPKIKNKLLDNYKSFLSAMDDESIEIIKSNSNTFWFDSLMGN